MFLLAMLGAAPAYAQLNVTPVTWNVVGLDSNNTSVGPNVYPVGVLACNTSGATINNIVGTLVWDTSNIYINTTGANPVTISSLAAGACTNIYFNIEVTRTTAAYNAARRYRINVSVGGVTVYTTPTPREIYVVKLVSQNRNSTDSVTGPSSVVVGQTYNYVMTGKTATGGYEQLESFLTFSNTIFQILSVATTYTAPAGATNNKIYADACGWENNPTSANYRSCVGPVGYAGGKAGSTIQTTYTVKILAAGSVNLSSMIYDFSGSSYHYANDYGASSLTITALTPPIINLVKSVNPSGTQPPGTDLTYTISFSNTGAASASNFIITDQIPANTDFKIGSIINNLGTTGLNPVIEYSNDNGTTWTHTPLSSGGGAPAGYDRAMTHVRWRLLGSLSQIPPNNAGNVSFIVQIR